MTSSASKKHKYSPLDCSTALFFANPHPRPGTSWLDYSNLLFGGGRRSKLTFKICWIVSTDNGSHVLLFFKLFNPLLDDPIAAVLQLEATKQQINNNKKYFFGGERTNLAQIFEDRNLNWSAVCLFQNRFAAFVQIFLRVVYWNNDRDFW